MDSSGALLYDPVLNLNPHSRNIHFQPSFTVKDEYYGNVFVLSSLSRFYTVSNTLI